MLNAFSPSLNSNAHALRRRFRKYFLYRNLQNFQSQAGQDRWVVETLKGKKNGFFLEIGASDGVNLSNTYALERELGWTGCCVEPNPMDYAKLRKDPPLV
ncbi:hypothetical protein N9H39_03180 [Gammaproteobacteria bacterium]|nr:hypothetical protein [Gammaproteobacteria bacterium]